MTFCSLRALLPAAAFLSVPLLHAAAPAGYSLVWEDDFDGTAMDTNKWQHRQLGPRNSATNTADAVSVANGQLTITTYTESGPHYTGMIGTQNTFLRTYGYYEASIDFNGAAGSWSAFWLQSPSMGSPVGNAAIAGTEIDVIELRSHPTNGQHGNSALHWDGYGADHQSIAQHYDGTALMSGTHTYGLLWTVAGYTFYIDGQEVWKTSNAASISMRPEYMILSSEVNNGSWASNIPSGGYGSKETSTTTFNVDYVRVYGLAESTWNNGNGTWGNTANWNTAFNDGTNARFDGAAGNTVTLDTAINADALTIVNSNNLVLNGSAQLAIATGIGVADTSQVHIDVPLALAGDNTWTLQGGRITVNGATSGGGLLTLQGTKGVNGTDTPTFVFTNASTRTGRTVLMADTLVLLGVDNALGNGVLDIRGSSRLGVNGGQTVVLDNALWLESGAVRTFNFGSPSSTGTLKLTGNTTLGGYAKTFYVTGAVEFAGNISSSSAPDQTLAKTGTGTLTLSGDNTYSFKTALSAGTLLLGSNTAVSTGTLEMRGGTTLGNVGEQTITLGNQLTLEGGAMHTFNFGNSAGTGKLILTQDVGLGGYGKTFQVSGALEIQGALTGSYNAAQTQTLVKDGTGALILSGNNTYGFHTAVNAGTLVLNGTYSAPSDAAATVLATTVSTDGTLAGTGTLGGAGARATTLTVQGTLAPGDPGAMHAAGALTVNGNVTLAPGARFVTRLHGAANDNDFSRLIVNGVLTLDSTAELQVVLTGTAQGIYEIISGFTSINGIFKGLENGDQFLASGQWFAINYGTDAITLTAIPEPSTYALALGAGVVGLLALRRRR